MMTCIFVIDPRWFKQSHFQSCHLGLHRWRFLQQSILDLKTALREVGQNLLMFKGYPLEVLTNIIHQSQIDIVGSGFHPGVYERQQWQTLQHRCPEVRYIQNMSHCLFEEKQLTWQLTDLPETFTPFRKKAESIKPAIPCPAPQKTPQFFNVSCDYRLYHMDKPDNSNTHFIGGSQAGIKQLNYFLRDSHNVRNYKQTRNDLDGWNYSSKLSCWLANGSLSPRQVHQSLKAYEQAFGANESTYWVFFELLWREFFQWYLVKHRARLFHFSGVRQTRPLTTFMPQRFARWSQGDTPYPIVNACMKQLNQTGFMSNRGRQLVASCLVHELGVDWRYGAAYFEQQLIDFDVASNWGNWQYLAGVGADPRGHRHFDLDKQTRIYDPQQGFIRRWQGQANVTPLDTTDAADWPL